VFKLKLSGNVDRIFEEVANPDFRYELTVELSIQEIAELLGFMVSAKLLESADQQIKDGGSQTPARLLLEFMKAAEIANTR